MRAEGVIYWWFLECWKKRQGCLYPEHISAKILRNIRSYLQIGMGSYPRRLEVSYWISWFLRSQQIFFRIHKRASQNYILNNVFLYVNICFSAWVVQKKTNAHEINANSVPELQCVFNLITNIILIYFSCTESSGLRFYG